MTRAVGTPTWIDLGSNDLATSRAFYEGLFGWEFEDTGEQMMHYNMVRAGGTLIGGAMQTSGMTCPDGADIPSSWTVYLAVDDVDARTRLAAEHGARVIVEPRDAGAAGRHAQVIDPSGAVVALWQPGDIEGYEFTGSPGTPAWFEVMTQDYQAACDFYTRVFDFTLVPMTGDGGEPINYSTNGPAQSASSGICDAAGFIPQELGSFWRVYFLINDAQAATERVKALGGKVLDGPEDTPFGRILTIADPEGATFQLCSPDEGQSPA